MSKGIILLDIPKNCYECKMLNGSDECILQDEDTNDFYFDDHDGLKNGCPIQELPGRHNTYAAQVGEQWAVFNKGWNACLDAITGQQDEET